MGIILMVLSGICFSFTGTWTAFVAPYGVNDLMLTILRLFSACVLMGIILLIKRADFAMTRQQVKASIIYGSLGMTFTVYLISMAVEKMSAGATSLCHYAYPILVALAGTLICHEKFRANKIIAAVLMIGGLLISNNGGSMNLEGTLIALFSAVTFAFYVFGQEHSAMAQVEPFKLFFFNSLFGTLAATIIALISGQFVIVDIPEVYLFMFMGGAITDLCGTVFMTLGIRKIGATTAAFLSVLEPALSNVWDMIFFHSALTLPSLVGMTLIFAAFLTMAYHPSKTKKA